MKLLIISKYPTPSAPQLNVFVYRLVQEMVALGNSITIISPKKVTLKNLIFKKPYYDKATVYQPLFISASNRKIGKFNSYRLTYIFTLRAIRRVLRRKNIEYDLIYCHFWESGFLAYDVFFPTLKPIVIAFGDSYGHYTRTISSFSKEKYKSLIDFVSGYVSVSKRNMTILIQSLIDSKDILLSPNATDTSTFYPRSKREMRQKYDLPLDVKIVIFIGTFKESKGYDRLMSAIKGLEGIYAILLGEGHVKLDMDKILFKGRVKHPQLAELLSCADLFALPTKDEGSCNAIIEAMTCGLPIVSSDIPAVEEQCDPSFSILINPDSIEDIREAITSVIFDETKLKIMSKNALEYSKRYSLTQRARDISNFLEGYVKNS